MPVTASSCVNRVDAGDGLMRNNWKIIHRNGVWRVYNGDVWHDSCETLVEAHTYATQLAVADVLFEPGGLTLLKWLQSRR